MREVLAVVGIEGFDPFDGGSAKFAGAFLPREGGTQIGDVVEEAVSLGRENPVDFTGYTRQMEAVGTHDTYDRLPEIKMPTLVIAGDKDRLIPIENSRIIASRIPGAELVILEGMGHGFYTEARDETARILIDFMKRHAAS